MIAARIQAHPTRALLVRRLLPRLNPLPTEAVFHESYPPSPWDGYKLCLRHPPDCSHLLIIQDDAVPCRDFVPAVEQVAASNLDTPVCLFLSSIMGGTASYARRAMQRNQRYVSVYPSNIVLVVAILWPRHKAIEFLAWAESGVRLPGHPRPRADDGIVARWMKQTKQPFRVTVPSLVEHPDMEPSLIGRRRSFGKDRGRVALHMASSGLDYEW